jgi:hypothetical protein
MQCASTVSPCYGTLLPCEPFTLIHRMPLGIQTLRVWAFMLYGMRGRRVGSMSPAETCSS